MPERKQLSSRLSPICHPVCCVLAALCSLLYLLSLPCLPCRAHTYLREVVQPRLRDMIYA